MTQTVLTTCPFCASGCGLVLRADGGRTVGVAPSARHPISRGRLCARGWAAHEAVSWGPRLTSPLIRRGGALEPVTWKEAMARATEGLARLRESGRRVGVLGSSRATNEENYLAGRLARAALGTNDVDFCMRAAHRALFDGIADVIPGFRPTLTLDDIEESDLILLVEGDLAQSHPRVASSVLAALTRGAHLVTLGAVETQMGRLARLHLPMRPGGEGEVLHKLIASVLVVGGERLEAARNWGGFAVLTEKVAASSPYDTTREIAQRLLAADRVVALLVPTGSAPSQARRDSAALASLVALTGHLGRPGCGLLPLVTRGNQLGAWEAGVDPELLPGRRALTDDAARARVEGVWNRPVPAEAGLDASAMLGAVEGLLAVATDPSASLGEPARFLHALEERAFVVVLDAFPTPLAHQADVVLPIAGFGENDGTVTNLQGWIQRVRSVLEAPGQARCGWEVLAELGDGLGHPTPFDSPADVFRELAQVAPTYAGISAEALEGAPVPTAVPPLPPINPHLRGTSPALPTPEAPLKVLAIRGGFDWGLDPLVAGSPTLSRDHVSDEKLHPEGLVELSLPDAQALGVRPGGRVKLSSNRGQIVLPIAVCSELTPGVLLVPFQFRAYANGLLEAGAPAAVRVERA